MVARSVLLTWPAELGRTGTATAGEWSGGSESYARNTPVNDRAFAFAVPVAGLGGSDGLLHAATASAKETHNK
jgi:hypothetical protein